MDDPTISFAFQFVEYVEKQIEAGCDADTILTQEKFIELNKSIQDGRLKSASSPSYFIMTINMKSPAINGEGIAKKRRKLLSIIMRSFFSAVIFCQELPGYFEKEVVAECGASGYKCVRNEKESAVIWREEDFSESTDGPKITDTWIRELRNTLPDASQLLSRATMVNLISKSSDESVLAVSWHGRHKIKDDAKKREFESLNTFLTEVIKRKKITSYIIGGDFNLNTLEVELPKDVVVGSYELSPKQRKAQLESSRYIPYKDDFVFHPKGKIRVSWTRPFQFGDETADSDLTKNDHEIAQEEMAKGTNTPPEMTDMLDHDPIVGVMEFLSPSVVRDLSKDFEKVEI